MSGRDSPLAPPSPALTRDGHPGLGMVGHGVPGGRGMGYQGGGGMGPDAMLASHTRTANAMNTGRYARSITLMLVKLTNLHALGR